jgi:plastocyanin
MKKIMIPVLCIGLLFVLSACAAFADTTVTPTAQAATSSIKMVVVQIRGNKFIPDTLTITLNTRVSWENMDGGEYTVHADNADFFRSSPITGDRPFRYLFTQTGDYPYYCDDKGGPGGTGMSGIVHVTK